MHQQLDWDDLRFFLAVVREGSLSAAARGLRVNEATVRRRVCALERALGGSCLVRRPTGYALSDLGEAVLHHAERIAAEMDFLGGGSTIRRPPAPPLVIGIAADIAATIGLQVMSALRASNPHLTFEIHTEANEALTNPHEPDVYIGFEAVECEGWAPERAASIVVGLFASSDYVDRRGSPRRRRDLLQHDLIDVLDPAPRLRPAVWFKQLTRLRPACFYADQVNQRLAGAKSGLGVTWAPISLGARAGLLQLVFHKLPSLDLWISWREIAVRRPQTRRLVGEMRRLLRSRDWN